MDAVPDSYRESNHLHLIISAKENNISDVLGDFKKFTSKKLIDSILAHPGESRKEWMINFSRKLERRIVEIEIINSGNKITSLKLFIRLILQNRS